MECLGACPVRMSSACPVHSSSGCPVHLPSGCPVHLASACPIHLSSACFMNFIPGWEAWHEAIKDGIWKIIGNCTVLHISQFFLLYLCISKKKKRFYMPPALFDILTILYTRILKFSILQVCCFVSLS